jgi:hypothetical protein
MSLGIVYHCALITVLGIISFGSSDPTGTARGDLFKFVLLLLYIFGAHSARGTGFRFDYNLLLYLEYIVFWVYLACWHTL